MRSVWLVIIIMLFFYALTGQGLEVQRKPDLTIHKKRTLKKTIIVKKKEVKKTTPAKKTLLRDQDTATKKQEEKHGIYSDIMAHYKDDQEEDEDYREARTSLFTKNDFSEMGGDVKSVIKKHHFNGAGDPHSVQGIPIIYTAKSTGFNIGARVSLANLKYEDPYTYKISFQYWASDRGAKKHEIALDIPHFFSKSWRARLSYSYPKTITEKYFGTGNDSVYNRSFTDPDSPNFLSRTYYQYTSTYPKLSFDLEYKIWKEVFSIYSGIALEKATIEPQNEDGRSKMYTDRPYGYGGGKTNYIKGGIKYDSRDFEFNPMSGITIAATYTNHGKFIKSDYAHSNINLVYMGFFSFWRYFTFSQRIMIDQMWGDLPFFALSGFRSYNDYGGLGGQDFLRGAPSFRYVDNLKFANQFELRTRVFYGKALGQQMMIHFNPFWDMGRVWDRKKKISLTRFHHSFGNEFRFTWNESFVTSITFGKSGSGISTYLTFGETFI